MEDEFDLGAAMESVAAEMASPEVPDAPEPPEPPETPVREPPKSWAKEKHELWAKLPPDAQEYYEVREKQFLDGLEQYKGDAGLARQFKEVITPYKPMLESMGISETDAVKFLLNAQYKLTNGTPEERRAAYDALGKDLGFIQQQQENVDPAVKQLQEKLNRVESALTARQQAEVKAAQDKAASEVDAFAKDPAHAYFDDVAQDMVPFIKSGLTMQDAYDRAIWANPVTRAKEQARLQTEAEKSLKEKADAIGKEAKKAASANIRGTQSRTAPTEPKGSIDDTMREVLKEMRERAH